MGPLLSITIEIKIGGSIRLAAIQMCELCRKIGVSSVEAEANGERWVAYADGRGFTIPESGQIRRWTISDLLAEEATINGGGAL